MKLVKTLAAAAVLAMSSFTSQAAIITVGDITWDSSYSSDFFAVSQLSQWWSQSSTLPTKTVSSASYIAPNIKNPGAVGTELMGVGLISLLNGNDSYSITGNNSLTYAFGGFSTRTTTNVPGFGSIISFAPTNAWWKIFVTPKASLSSNFSHADTFAAQAGTLFLEGTFDSFNLIGTIDTAQSNGYLKITGGLAQNAFKNGVFTNPATGTKHDFQVTGGASFQGKQITTGSLNFDSKSNVAVSAPSSLAIFGLGLVGLAGLTRRKQAK